MPRLLLCAFAPWTAQSISAQARSRVAPCGYTKSALSKAARHKDNSMGPRAAMNAFMDLNMSLSKAGLRAVRGDVRSESPPSAEESGAFEAGLGGRFSLFDELPCTTG